ncbi:EAL and HDOD domain-containing protein [Salibacterium halotolerans]|uniref:EAL and modified HD-GYP domain-containing signal transduction protein n=1 Tax=Salibacterium halotolerans TaxID=1884432 RepID=A0A1I5RJ55_9BACI|nr:EAL domain-containing protein [Salibacterium halotolerans]SFP58568.1 EAL and modified HD-GYP domain-containing signal transduction protein [Salibacterium halotolerans]
MSGFVAVQPIVNADEEIYGYELLYRASEEHDFMKEDPDTATFDVVSKGLLCINPDTVTGPHPAFFNFTEQSLLERLPLSLPASKITVEILEDIKGSDEMVEVLRELKESGYQIALDDFVLDHSNEMFLPFADIIKVDWQNSSSANLERIIESRRLYDFYLLAEKLESAAEFQKAKSMGFTLFQGYYFGCPQLMK